MTPKQERFIAEYCIDLNGTQAAIRAGCSPRSANRTASKWLSKADISREIAQRTKQQLEAAQLSAVRTLEELRRVAFSDIGRFFDARGNLRDRRAVLREIACESFAFAFAHLVE